MGVKTRSTYRCNRLFGRKGADGGEDEEILG